MRFTLRESIVMLDCIWSALSGVYHIYEGKMTPYQKAQQKRRQTIAAHTPRPAKQSAFYKHAVRAIFTKLRKSGESFNGSAKGGQLIAQWMLKQYGYAHGKTGSSGIDTGDFSLTSKGRSRNRVHAAEPAGLRKKKDKAYDYILGIQRRSQAKQQQVKSKSMGAG